MRGRLRGGDLSVVESSRLLPLPTYASSSVTVIVELCPPLDAPFGSLIGEEPLRRRRGLGWPEGTSDGSWGGFGMD